MLKIENLTLHYGATSILQDINITVSPGEVLGLIGPNGAGKSTLMRAVTGVIKPTAGAISWGDDNLMEFSPIERAKRVAVVSQAGFLGGAFSVQEVVLMGRTPYLSWLGNPGDGDKEIVMQVLGQAGIEHLAERRVAELSGGEQQLVLFARALAQTPALLLLDEPTNHLDLHHQSLLLSMVFAHAHEHGLAVMMALHDLNLVGLFTDKVALLSAGKVATIGTPNEVLTKEKINQAYRTEIDVVQHPEFGTPVILPSHNRSDK